MCFGFLAAADSQQQNNTFAGGVSFRTSGLLFLALEVEKELHFDEEKMSTTTTTKNSLMAASDITLEEWIAKTAKLIRLDYEEELEQNRVQCEKYSLKELEKSGFAIRKLVVTGQRNAFGRVLYHFALPPAKKDDVNLTTFGITNGDIVAVTTGAETGSKLSGVVLKMSRASLEVAFDPNAKELSSTFEGAEYFNLVKIANDVTYRRLKAAVDELFKCAQKTYLVRMLFGEEPLQEPLTVLPPYTVPLLLEEDVEDDQGIVWFNQNLNDSQREAIRFSLHARHLAVIHGPPGTGKTTTLTEVILQLVTRGQKVFVFAPSNVAVDNIFKQLLAASQAACARFKGALGKRATSGSTALFNYVRLGHPARVDDQLKGYALDQVVLNADSSVVADLRAELDQKTKTNKTGDGGKGHSHGRVHWGELRELRQQISQYESRAFTESLQAANVVFATLTSAALTGQLKYLLDATTNQKSSSSGSNAFMFDVAIVDECAQSLEAAAWIPLGHARKAILAGDHQQLPATIVSQAAADQGLGVSLIERVVHRLYAACPDQVVRMLTVQYRMNALIMDWPSAHFYQGRLVAAEGVKERRLRPKKKTGKEEPEPYPVIRLIDTVGCDMYELELEDSLSKGNKYEADIVALYIRELIEEGGIAPSEIGVISPYRLQTSMIAARCRQQFPDAVCASLEINSVDAFQGREKEVIILSLVRSNDQGEIGFLIEERRLNVAITRARSHLVVVGDSGTVSQGCKALESFMDYCYSVADVVTATDYLQAMDAFDELKIELRGRTKEVVNAKEVKRVTGNSNKNKGGGGKKGNPSKHMPKAKIPLAKASTTTTTAVKSEAGEDVGKQNATKENDEERRQKLQRQLENFLADGSATELKLPSTLNSFERRLVHELCETLALAHESVGEAPHRQLIVRKKVVPQ